MLYAYKIFFLWLFVFLDDWVKYETTSTCPSGLGKVTNYSREHWTRDVHEAIQRKMNALNIIMGRYI